MSSLFFCSPIITQPLSQWVDNLQRAALLTSLVQYDKIIFKCGQQKLVMMNYACGFNQSETWKYLE